MDSEKNVYILLLQLLRINKIFIFHIYYNLHLRLMDSCFIILHIFFLNIYFCPLGNCGQSSDHGPLPQHDKLRILSVRSGQWDVVFIYRWYCRMELCECIKMVKLIVYYYFMIYTNLWVSVRNLKINSNSCSWFVSIPYNMVCWRCILLLMSRFNEARLSYNSARGTAYAGQ